MRSSGSWWGWVVPALAIPLLIWLLSADGGESNENAEGADGADAGGAPSSMPTTRPPPTSPTLTTLAPSDAPLPADGQVSQVHAGPLLGRDSGMLLIVEDATLKTIDLDRGTEEHHRRTGRILGTVGDVLVLDPPDGPLVLVGSGDIDGPEVRVGLETGRGVAASSSAGHLWVMSGPEGLGRRAGLPFVSYDLVDIATGSVINHLEIRYDEVAPIPASPELVSGATGGVFELTDPFGLRYRPLIDGRLLAVLDGLALIQACDAPMTCERRWVALDVETATAVPRSPPEAVPLPPEAVPLPPEAMSGFAFPAVLDRYLTVSAPAGITLWSPLTGTVPGIFLNEDLFALGGVTALGDVIAFGRSSVTVLDVSTGEQVALSTGDVASMVLVRKPE